MKLLNLFLVPVFFVLASCDAQRLYVAHDTVLGINANVSPNRQRGRLIVGYDRDFTTVIPKSVPRTDAPGHDAMASLGCTNLEVEGPVLRKYRDLVVTGDAAIALGRQLRTGDFFECKAETVVGGGT